MFRPTGDQDLNVLQSKIILKTRIGRSIVLVNSSANFSFEYTISKTNSDSSNKFTVFKVDSNVDAFCVQLKFVLNVFNTIKECCGKTAFCRFNHQRNEYLIFCGVCFKMLEFYRLK